MTKSIFREVTIPYGGQAYPFTPSNRVLRRIEEEVSLTRLIRGLHSGKPAISQIAFVAAEFLREAGVEGITEDAVYTELVFDMQAGGGQISALCDSIIQSVTPTGDVAKNSRGSEGPVKPTAKKAPAKKT